MKYVWIINYAGCLSKEGYDSEEKAFEHLKEQGYKQVEGYKFYDGKYIAWVHQIKIV